MRVANLFCVCILCPAIHLISMQASAQQSGKDIYTAISETPSKTHWCRPAAGDDPAGIIGRVCQVYSDCLDSANLTQLVDQLPFPSLSEAQRTSIKKCHQALYNAARVNPQIKGSKATQGWLEHDVLQGTEAKSFAIPAGMSSPH